MKHNERLVWFYDIVMKGVSRTNPTPFIISTEAALEHLRNLPDALRIKDYFDGNHHYYIQSWDVRSDLHIILLNKTDKTLSDPTFCTPETKARRTIAKDTSEGQEFSCHIVIRPSDTPSQPALALIEQSNGIPPMVIQRFFNYLMNVAKKLHPGDFKFDHPDGSVDAKGNLRKYSARYMFELYGHPSNEFISDIQHGSLQGIELITERHKQQNWDQHGYFQESRKVVMLKPGKIGTIANIADSIRSVVSSTQNQYEKARIKFTTRNGLNRSITLDSGSFGVTGTDQYVKKAKIFGFDGPLQGSYETACPQIVNKMIHLIE